MSMAAKLQLRQGQTLAMTPQLLQSIRLLQLSAVELERHLADEAEKNPFLTVGDGQGSASDDHGMGGGDDRGRELTETMGGDQTIGDQLAVDAATLSSDLDTSLENVFSEDPGRSEPLSPELGYWSQSGQGGASSSSGGDFAADILEATLSARPTLRSHLQEQAALLRLPPTDAAIALRLIDGVDESGYFTTPLKDVADTLAAPSERVASVLARLKTLEPTGVFAADLAECLALQLAVRNRLDPAMRCLLAHLPLLAKRDFKALAPLCGVDVEDLVDMLAEIRALDPKPGLAFEHEGSDFVVPDVVVRASPDGTWHVDLNPETLPRVLVDRDYYQRVAPHCSNGDEKRYLSDQLQSASWIERALDQRARTILKVASEIVRQQDEFLTHGVSALKPMSLRSLAEKVDLHESTVSRVTMNKFMATPRGVFDMRYFFTVSIAASDGDDAHSAESVRHLIRRMIDAETAETVLSDDAIVERLKADKIDIARRTVAKYRDAMSIPSSVERRREKRALASV